MAGGIKVRLTISGTQYLQEKEPDQINEDEAQAPIVTKTQADALYYRRGDTHYLFYEEQPEGYPEPMKTRLKFRRDYLELIRQGTLGCRMVFETEKTFRTDYATPYGGLILDIETSKVCLEEKDVEWQGAPSVTVEYLLKNEGQLIGNYQLHLACNEF